MATYFYEITNQALSIAAVKAQFGNKVPTWHWTRQRDIGLYLADDLAPSFNGYTHKISGITYAKINSTDQRFNSNYGRDEYYVREFTYVALTGQEATDATAAAVVRVDFKAAKLLEESNKYITTASEEGYGLHPDLVAYRAALKDITNHPDYPETLAYEAYNKSYLSWPQLPANLYDPTAPSTVLSSGSVGDLGDIDISNPTDGDTLVYDSNTGVWSSGAVAGGGGASSMNDLTDVDTSAASANQMLVYDGAEWSSTSDLAGNAVLLYPVDVLGTTTSFTKSDYGTELLQLSPKVSLYRYGSGGHLVNLKADYGDTDDGWADADLNSGRFSDTLEWVAGDTGFWAGDVTDDTRNASNTYAVDQFNDVNDNDQAGILGAEWVLRDTDTGRYWKFEITVWDVSTGTGDDIPDGNVTNGSTTRPPYYTYTRTEYSDPVTGTLDATTATTVSVTGWADADTIDVIEYDPANPTYAIALHRGFNVGFTNPITGQADGDMYDDQASTNATFPYLTEMAVVNEWDEVLNPNLQYSINMDDAYNGGIGNKIIGSKLIVHTLDDDKYYGFTFSAWTQGGNGGGFTCEYGELDTSLNTGIRFSDGTVQTTLGGNANTDRARWDYTGVGGYAGMAPIAFHLNDGFMRTDSNNMVNTDFPQFDTLGVDSNYRLEAIANQYGGIATRVNMSSIACANISSSTNFYNYTSCSDTYTNSISWNSFSSSIDNRAYYRFNMLNFGTATQAIIAAPTDQYMVDAYARKVSYRTQLAFMNDRVGGTMTIVFENNHCLLNGFTLPSVAQGEVWIVEVETMYISAAHGYKRWVTNVFQAV